MFPEEIDSRFLRLGANRRKEINEHLKANGPQISEFLKFCMNSYGANPRYMNKILKCFNSWVRYQLVTTELIGTSPLTQQVFSLLNSPDTSRELHDTAADCMCTLLTTFLLDNILQNQNSPQQGITEMDIFNGILALENAYHTSVAHEDTDKVSNYCRIFTVLGETYVEKMISSENAPHYSIKSLDLVLVCVGHFDYDIAEITFNLWYQLSDELYTKNSDQLNSFFKPYIERLIGALYRHAKMESDHSGLIDETESFYVSFFCFYFIHKFYSFKFRKWHRSFESPRHQSSTFARDKYLLQPSSFHNVNYCLSTKCWQISRPAQQISLFLSLADLVGGCILVVSPAFCGN